MYFILHLASIAVVVSFCTDVFCHGSTGGGKDVTGLKLDEVNKLLNGASGSKVRVKLSRAGMPFDVTLVRAEDSAGKKAPTGCSPIDQTQFTGSTFRFLYMHPTEDC